MNGSNLLNESILVTTDPPVPTDDCWSINKVLQVGGFVVAAIVLVVGNGLVLYCIARFRFLQNPADIFVAVLSGLDFTYAISVAIQVVHVADPTVFVGLPVCQFRLILGISNCMASGLALLGIAVTRYLGTFKPFFYESMVTSRRVAYIAVFIVVYPVSVMTGLTLRFHRWQPNMPCLSFIIYPPGVVLFIHMHGYLILPTLGIIYLKIALEVARLRRRVAAMIPAPLEGSPQNRGAAVPGQVLEEQRRQLLNLRTLKNFGIIVAIFTICYLPYILLAQVMVTDPFYYLQQPTVMNVLTGVTLLVVLNSMVNPFVYAVRFKRFGVAFRYAFKCITKHELEKHISDQFN